MHEAVRDQLHVRAAMLSYWTLVTLVPLLVLVYAVLGLLGADAAAPIEGLLADVLPANDDQRGRILAFVHELVDGVSLGTLGVVGVVVVLFTASRIYFSVEDAYNALWNTRARRSWAMRMVLFYTTLTLVPLLIAAGFHFSTDVAGGSLTSFWLPVLITTAAFVGAIRLLPDTRVDWGPALAGGLVSAVAFEGAKVAFGTYLALFSSTSVITRLYGSLGFLPIFLTWLYTLWIIALLGVELAYCIQRREPLVAAEELRVLGDPNARCHADALFATQCLLVVARRFARGDGPTPEVDVTRALDTDARLVRYALEVLEDAGILAESPRGYVPALPLDALSLREVIVRYRAQTRPATAAGATGESVIDGLLAPGAGRLDTPLNALV